MPTDGETTAKCTGQITCRATAMDHGWVAQCTHAEYNGALIFILVGGGGGGGGGGVSGDLSGDSNGWGGRMHAY